MCQDFKFSNFLVISAWANKLMTINPYAFKNLNKMEKSQKGKL